LADLQRRIVKLEGSGRPRRHRWRSVLSAVLVTLAALPSVLSVVAVWADSMVEDTDRCVDTVALLVEDPGVQTAVTNRATTVILEQIDVKALVAKLSAAVQQERAPPAAAELIGELSGPIENGLKKLVSSTVHRIVSSSAFEPCGRTPTALRTAPWTKRSLARTVAWSQGHGRSGTARTEATSVLLCTRTA
jgi:hypothetical protein